MCKTIQTHLRPWRLKIRSKQTVCIGFRMELHNVESEHCGHWSAHYIQKAIHKQLPKVCAGSAKELATWTTVDGVHVFLRGPPATTWGKGVFCLGVILQSDTTAKQRFGIGSNVGSVGRHKLIVVIDLVCINFGV